jgi:hypothetical protein
MSNEYSANGSRHECERLGAAANAMICNQISVGSLTLVGRHELSAIITRKRGVGNKAQFRDASYLYVTAAD